MMQFQVKLQKPIEKTCLVVIEQEKSIAYLFQRFQIKSKGTFDVLKLKRQHER